MYYKRLNFLCHMLDISVNYKIISLTFKQDILTLIL